MSRDYLGRVRREGGRLQGDGRGKALLAISAGSFLLIGVQMVYPVLLPEMRATYGFDLTTAGFLLTLLWVANATGQLPGGVLADRLGDRTTLLVGVIVSAVTLVLIVTVNSVVALFGATVLLGFGLSLYGVARYTAMYALYPDRAGTTVGFVLAAADAGQAVLPPLASVIAVASAWQFGFGVTMPLFALVALGLWLFVPAGSGTRTSDEAGVTVRGLTSDLGVLRTRKIGYGSAVFVVYVSVWVAFTSFYPTYLIEIKDLSPTVGAVLFGSFFMVGIVIKPLSGAAYDRVGIRGSLGVIAPVAGLALAALPVLEGIAPLFVATVLVAPILGSGTISQSFLIEAMGEENTGTGLGLVRTCGMLVAATTPVAFGALADRGIFDEVFLLLAALVGGLFLLVLRIPRAGTASADTDGPARSEAE